MGLTWAGIMLLAATLAQAEPQPTAVVAPRPGGTFSSIRVRPQAAAPALSSSTRVRAPGDILQWSTQTTHAPTTVPRPQASIVFPNIGPNVTLPPRPAGTRGSSYVAPTLRQPSRRAAVRW